MRRAILWCVVAFLMAGTIACSEFETEYFKDRINVATMERVAKRYGPPHKSEQVDGDKIRWTYFNRGSGTSSYSGYARSSFCRVYILTFDQREILRDWKQEDCEA